MGNIADEKIVFSQILVAFKDPKCYFTAVIYGTLGLAISSVSTFLPTFISEFGFDKRKLLLFQLLQVSESTNQIPVSTQLYSMIPYAFGTVTLLGVCLYSDRLNSKGPFLFLCMATSAIGYVILIATTNPVALIAGTCFVAAGLYPSVILTVSWITINHGGYTKRATAFAMAQITSQGLSIMGTQIYRNPPRYIAGHGTLLGFFCLALCAITCNFLWMRRENRKRDALAQEFVAAGTKNPDSEKKTDELFDYHPDFRYIL